MTPEVALSVFKMSNYHMMVRSEVMRVVLEIVFSTEPFVANEKTAVNIKLQDVMHVQERT
jgi:hypothetical protein